MSPKNNQPIENEYFDLIVSRDELGKSLERAYNRLDKFRSICTTILSSSSILAAFLSAFQMYFGRPAAGWKPVYDFGMIAMLSAYLVLVFFAISVILPAQAFGPIDPTEEEIRSAFFGKSKDDVLLMQISGFLNAIKLTKQTVSQRSRQTKWACFLLPVVVIIFMLMLLIPRI